MTSPNGRSIAVLVAVWLAAAVAAVAASAQEGSQNPTTPADTQGTVQAPVAPSADGTAPAPATPPAQSPAATTPAAAPPAHSAAPPGTVSALARNGSRQADAWKADLDNMALALQRDGLEDGQLAEMRGRADSVLEEARKLEAALQPELAGLQERLGQLGAPPAEGQPAESADLAARRANESAALAEVDAVLRKVRLVVVQAEQIGREIAAQRRDRFAQALAARNRSVLNPSLWLDGVADVPKVYRSLSLLLRDSWTYAVTRGSTAALLTLAAAGLLAIVVAAIARNLIGRFSRRGADGAETTRLMRLTRAILVMTSDVLIPVGAIAVIFTLLDNSGLVTARLAGLNRGFLGGVTVFAFLFGLSRGICAPLRPGWRLVPLSDAVAAQTVATVTVVAAVLAIAVFLESLNDLLVAPISVDIVKRAATSLLIALALASGLWRLSIASRELPEEGAVAQNVLWTWIRGFLWLAIALILAALLAGFIALANFIAVQLVFAGAVIAIAWVLLALVDSLADDLFAPTTRTGHALSSAIGIGDNRVAQLSLVVSGVLRALIILIAAVMVLLPWGFDTGQWRNWIQHAFFGFRIGEVTISPSLLLTGLILFAIGIAATRGVQHWLGTRFLPSTQLDLGLRNSIQTIVGYVGIVLAAIFTVTYMGFNLQNLAIVAGALSVGIGFGLQSIVGNFVSGLILLAERPIKEGDWIVVGADQGNVRKISIRATEIETFDRATVIVPNSDLITGTVKNWMHSNMMGRVDVTIGVGYGSDPDQVRDIMLDIARSHAGVLAYPEPRVFFVDFADSSLTFTLFAYVGDVNTGFSVRSDFRFQILRRFREAGIEIPFPQRDVNLRDIDRLESAILASHPMPVPKGST